VRHAQCTRSVLAAWCQPWALLPGCPPPGQPWKTCEVPLYVSAPAMSFQAKAVLESPRNSKVDNIDVRDLAAAGSAASSGSAWQRPHARLTPAGLIPGKKIRDPALRRLPSAVLPFWCAACCLATRCLASTRPPLFGELLRRCSRAGPMRLPSSPKKPKAERSGALSHRPSLPHSIPAARTAHRCDDHILELSESTPPVAP
jgi:hypothetical protein